SVMPPPVWRRGSSLSVEPVNGPLLDCLARTPASRRTTTLAGFNKHGIRSPVFSTKNATRSISGLPVAQGRAPGYAIDWQETLSIPDYSRALLRAGPATDPSPLSANVCPRAIHRAPAGRPQGVNRSFRVPARKGRLRCAKDRIHHFG